LAGTNLGGAEDFHAAMEAGLGGAQGLGEVADLNVTFPETLWKERVGNGLQTDASTPEITKETDGKAGGNIGRADAVMPENGCEDARIRGLGESVAFLFFLKVEADVDGGGAAGPVDFQGPKEDEGFTAGGTEPGKVVRDEKTGRVGEIRNAVGVAEEETGGPGHDQEDFRRAPARKPARRKPSRTRGSLRSRPKR
jgi:hypothetical protein